MVVSNTSPLINFGKRGLLGILKGCFKGILIPEGVYEEILCRPESPEAISLKKAINDDWIEVKKTEKLGIVESKKVGEGEKEAISLAFKEKEVLLVDDDIARAYASVIGVEARGTLYVLLLACSRGIIDKNKVGQIVDNFIIDGFYISTEVYSKFLEMLENAVN